MNKYNFLKPSNKLEIILDNNSYFCTIYYVENDKLTVFFDKHTELPEKEIEVNIYAEDGIYSATSRILSSNYLNETTFYMLSFPSNIKHSQRREYLRADIETDFALKVMLEGTQIEKIISTTKNICAKGLAFVVASLGGYNAGSKVAEKFVDEYRSSKTKTSITNNEIKSSFPIEDGLTKAEIFTEMQL